jgi:hypothetical protein
MLGTAGRAELLLLQGGGARQRKFANGQWQTNEKKELCRWKQINTLNMVNTRGYPQTAVEYRSLETVFRQGGEMGTQV